MQHALTNDTNVKKRDKRKVYDNKSTTGVLKSDVMTLRPGSSAEDGLKTVTLLELEDGINLDEYDVIQY